MMQRADSQGLPEQYQTREEFVGCNDCGKTLPLGGMHQNYPKTRCLLEAQSKGGMLQAQGVRNKFPVGKTFICIANGAVNHCSRERYVKHSQWGGVCAIHSNMPLATAPGKTQRPYGLPGDSRPATPGRGGGGRISVCNMQSKIDSATDRKSPPSLCTSTTAPKFSDDKKISAWIWKSS